MAEPAPKPKSRNSPGGLIRFKAGFGPYPRVLFYRHPANKSNMGDIRGCGRDIRAAGYLPNLKIRHIFGK
jgi:hypothetical protein